MLVTSAPIIYRKWILGMPLVGSFLQVPRNTWQFPQVRAGGQT